MDLTENLIAYLIHIDKLLYSFHCVHRFDFLVQLGTLDLSLEQMIKNWSRGSDGLPSQASSWRFFWKDAGKVY